MIIETAQLGDYGGQVAMVDGSFDPLHDGHIAYFRGAAEFGIPVLCNVASDSWTVTKHQVLLSQVQRGAVIDAIEVVKHDWKAGGHTRYGMIAQDLHMVAPEAVSVGDADDVEDFKNPWGVDYSKLVPMLVKELQSLRKRVAELESK